MAEVHYRTCHLCEAMCGLEVTLRGRTIERIVGDRQDPFSRGHICPKAAALADIHEDPDRLTRPMRRRGDRWSAMPWDEALALVAERLVETQVRYGPPAVAMYTGNPVVHNYGSVLHGQLLQRALGTPNSFSATSLDQLPHMLAAYQMFGHQLRLPIPDVDRTRLILLLGANPAVSNGSLMTAGDIKRALRGVRDRGGRVVVIDPRRTETARLASEHVFVRPGGDAALLAAMVQHVLARHGAQLGPLADHVNGLEALAAAVAPFTPDRVAPAIRVPAEVIRRLADELATTRAAVVYGRVGACTQAFGGLAGWLLYAVNVVTGHLDRPGGAMFPTPAVDVAQVAGWLGKRGSFDRRRSRVHGWPEFGGEYPTPALADEILTEGDGQIRALITSAGNPVLSSPGGHRLAEALRKLDFMASIDIYLNETTRFADVILPPTFGLEHDHYDLIFHGLAVRNSAKYSPAAWPRRDDQRHDWEIYAALAERIEARRPASGLARLGRAAGSWFYGRLARTSPADLVNGLLLAGPYRLRLDHLKAAPHGIDLGPMRPRLPQRIETPSGKIELAPAIFIADLPRLGVWLDAPAPALSLIGRRHLRSNNSWMHNSRRLIKGRPACTLSMHPRDAAERQLASGQLVRISTDAGSVVAPLELDDRLMPGVVCLPHGWGHGGSGVRLRVAATQPGVSSNDVIRPVVDPLSGTAQLNGVPVDVTAA